MSTIKVYHPAASHASSEEFRKRQRARAKNAQTPVYRQIAVGLSGIKTEERQNARK